MRGAGGLRLRGCKRGEGRLWGDLFDWWGGRVEGDVVTGGILMHELVVDGVVIDRGS